MYQQENTKQKMGCKKPIKKMIFPLIFLFLGLGFFMACNKDFSTNSNTEPFPIVYGLLDVNDSVHYIKIYKSFVVEGNAYDAVTDINKYSFIDSIDVYLIEYNAFGDSIRTIVFDTTTSIPKDSGLYEYPTQILYKAHATLHVDNSYKLVIFNPYTRNITETKELLALASPPVIIESAFQIYFYVPKGKKDFEFRTGKNTTRYFVRIKYYYTEKLYNNTSRQPEPVIWDIGNIVDYSAKEGIEKSLSILEGVNFFIRISSEVKEDKNVRIRHTDSILYEIYAAAKDFDLYLRSNIPPTGINQEKLYYSNLRAYNIDTKKGQYVRGFLSSRTKTTKYYRDLRYPARDSLFYGRFTGHLLFTDLY